MKTRNELREEFRQLRIQRNIIDRELERLDADCRIYDSEGNLKVISAYSVQETMMCNNGEYMVKIISNYDWVEVEKLMGLLRRLPDNAGCTLVFDIIWELKHN